MQKNSGEKKGRVVLKTNFDLNVTTKSHRNIGWWVASAFLVVVLLVVIGYFVFQTLSLSSGQVGNSARDISAEKK